jgi:hypothetical protein
MGWESQAAHHAPGKGAVKSKKRHDANLNVWSATHAVQDR